jgi:hypothetical protein
MLCHVKVYYCMPLKVHPIHATITKLELSSTASYYLFFCSVISALSGETKCLFMFTQEMSPSIITIIPLLATTIAYEGVFESRILLKMFLNVKIRIQQKFIMNLGSNLELMWKNKINCSWLLSGLYNLCSFISLMALVK